MIIPERESILLVIKKLGRFVSLNQLVREFNLSNEEEILAFSCRLHAMVKDKQISFNKKKGYKLTEKLVLVEGKVIANPAGFGFLAVENENKDLFIPHDEMRKVIHDDFVIAQKVDENNPKGASARIIRIKNPANPTIIGRLFVSKNNRFFVKSQDPNFHFLIEIPENSLHLAKENNIVVVNITKRIKRNFIGEIIQILGENWNLETEITSIIHKYELPNSWNENIKQELQKYSSNLTENDRKDRVDLTDLPFVTIDGEDSRDFDDAIFVKRMQNYWKLFVSIADVSYYVKPGSAIDLEAKKRGTSVYFPLKVIPMLPTLLSNDLCSLNPNVERLCFTAEIDLSDEGNILSSNFYSAIMKSHARLTYTEVAYFFENNQFLNQKNDNWLSSLLSDFKTFFQVLLKSSELCHAIDFKTEESFFEFDENNRVKNVKIVETNDAHKLIEKCMILTNVVVAKFAQKNNEPILYRIHEKPTEKNVTKLRLLLNELGLSLPGNDIPTSDDYSTLIKEIESRKDQQMIHMLLLRSLKQAIYTPENKGHFGLSLETYAHFTSPIRRYPDLLLHRSLKAILANKKQISNSSAFHYSFEQMFILGEHCSLAERRAEDAARDVDAWLKCEFMQTKIGESFKGTISGITNFGFFVQINELFIDGLVHISTLPHDHYFYDEVRNKLIGQISGNVFGLSDAVEILVERVNIEERKIDFSLASFKKKIKKRKTEKIILSPKIEKSKKRKKLRK